MHRRFFAIGLNFLIFNSFYTFGMDYLQTKREAHKKTHEDTQNMSYSEKLEYQKDRYNKERCMIHDSFGNQLSYQNDWTSIFGYSTILENQAKQEPRMQCEQKQKELHKCDAGCLRKACHHSISLNLEHTCIYLPQGISVLTFYYISAIIDEFDREIQFKNGMQIWNENKIPCRMHPYNSVERVLNNRKNPELDGASYLSIGLYAKRLYEIMQAVDALGIQHEALLKDLTTKKHIEIVFKYCVRNKIEAPALINNQALLDDALCDIVEDATYDWDDKKDNCILS